MYKKIPIWQHKQKIITIPQQTSLTFSSHLYLQPIPPIQLTPIFINHDFQILTSSFHLSQYNLQPTFQHPHTKTQHKNTTLTNIHNLIQQQKIEQNEYTLVYNRMINKVIGLTMTIYACGTLNNKYWICYCDCGGRMRITKFNDNFWENIVKLSKNNSLQYKYERQQEIDTVVLPLPKYQQFLYYYNNMVFLTGNQCVWQWEITSKVWGFNLQQNRWMQFLEDVQSTQFKQQKIRQQKIRQQKIRQDNEKTSKSKLKANQKNKSMEKDKIRQNQRYSSKNKDNKQKSKIKIKQKIKNLPQFQQKQKVTKIDHKNQWVLMIQNVLIFIGNNYIHFQLIKNNKISSQIKKIQLTEDDQPLLSTQFDTFITCSYSLRNNSTNSPHLFILTKPQNPQKQPILLSFSLTTFLQYHNTSSHYNSNIHMHSFSHPQSLKSQQPKQFLKSTIVNSTDTPITQSKSLKIDQNLYINVVRYDLGVFLFHGIQNNLNLWKVVNEIVFMQIYSSVGEGGNFMQSMSLADGNFARKNQQNNFRSNNKNLIIILYSKAKKSLQTNNFCMQMQTYSMKLHILQQINFKEASKPLSHYFQKKQYNDLLFLAQKRQVLCSRQLFEFYSSKFKKLYSNSSSSQQNQQQQTLVKLDHTKLSTIYFLVQHMFNNFTIELKGFDQDMLIDLMILSHKFQVSQMQMLCQQQIKFTITNFTKLYDYFRNAQTTHFREQYLKSFIIHAQDIIKTMPIGKVQQLIRLVYSPDCPHTNIIELKSKLQNNYIIKDTDNEQKQIHKSINYCNIIKNQQINIKICLKCHRLVTFNYENHRKNKSSFRDHSIGIKNKKKDNNSN